jgi:predicted transcriptional regulator
MRKGQTKKDGKRTRMTVRLPEELRARMAAWADVERVTEGEIVRRALAAYTEGRP